MDERSGVPRAIIYWDTLLEKLRKLGTPHSSRFASGSEHGAKPLNYVSYSVIIDEKGTHMVYLWVE